MAQKYTLTVLNHATRSNYIMMYQDNPGAWAPNALSLAWFSKFSNPGQNVTVTFTWEIEWGFSWADTGTFQPQITYQASQTAKVADGNQITLDYNGAYQFVSQQDGNDPNRFYLRETANIPVASQGSVGITLGGSTVYATQAQPHTNLTFSPNLSYHVAYGNYVQGDVLNVSEINTPLKLEYPSGVYNLTTTLRADNTFSPPISSAELNARILEVGQANPDKHWTELELF